MMRAQPSPPEGGCSLTLPYTGLVSPMIAATSCAYAVEVQMMAAGEYTPRRQAAGRCGTGRGMNQGA